MFCISAMQAKLILHLNNLLLFNLVILDVFLM